MGKNHNKQSVQNTNELQENTPQSTDNNTTEMVKLQLNYMRREHAIKIKAISDREAVDLDHERKRYNLLRSLVQFDKEEEFVKGIFDETSDGMERVIGSQQNDSPPNLSKYATPIVTQLSGSPGGQLTSQQICARQVISPDLPLFSGNPEDWPVFYSQYKNSTLACCYNHSENLVRLQKCIKGKALEYVRSRLLLPELVPKVIDTLKMLYGQPNVLVSSLINRVRSIPPPNSEKLETVIEYGMAIQNLFDHLTAMDLTDHLQSPSLLQELEAKLPGEIMLQWIRYKRKHAPSSLKALNEFMNELVETACEVKFMGSEPRCGMRKEKQYHSATDRVAVAHSESTDNRSCFVCRERNHRVRDCRVFESFHVSHRWRLVGELKLCRCCLNRHTGRACQDAYECGIDECQLLHHPLLHQNRNQ